MATRRTELEEAAAAAGQDEEAGSIHGVVPEGPERLTDDFPSFAGDPDEIPTRVKVPTDAKPDKGKRIRGSGSRRNTAAERDLADIGEQLEEKFAVIFGLAAGLAPVTAVYGTENAPKAINALLDIAKRRPAVLRALTTVADGANALEIGKFVLGLLVCIQIDTGRLNGDEIQAKAFGVTQVMLDHDFLQVVDENGNPVKKEKPTNPYVTNQDVPNAVRFQPIP